jgi:nitrogen regulatory protein P-II 1
MPHGGVSRARVDTILKTAKTGKIGDGKILLTRVDEAIRVRDEERAKRALSRS